MQRCDEVIKEGKLETESVGERGKKLTLEK